MDRPEFAWLITLDRQIGRICNFAAILALPVSVLLFLQWPLRELVQAYSREANDLAQALFACYVSIAVTYATRRGTHLHSDILARRYPAQLRRHLQRAAGLMLVMPWALFVLWSGWGLIVASLKALESFPETYNPGYFLLKSAVGLLALVALVQAVIAVLSPDRQGEH
jgi:TRAP-type mannitol/chloroaromatic compound transport system permease small subunit